MTTAGPTRVPRLLTVVTGALLLGLLPGLVPGGRAFAVSGDSDPVGVWPLSPRPAVVAGFDPPGSVYGAGHRGVDLAGHVDQVVRTALAGTVSYAGLLAGRGVVVVDHGDTRTTYQPVAATAHVGDPVAAGAPIGTLQLGGSHCLPAACLHWGWILGHDTYLDPLRLVGAGPVRLLPLAGAPAGPASSGVSTPARPAVPGTAPVPAVPTGYRLLLPFSYPPRV